MIWILIVILGVGLDQWTKYWAVSELAVRGDMAVIDPLIYFRYHVNTGAAWSFLADKSWGIYVLSGVSLIASIAFLLILLKLKDARLRFCLSLVLAGSIGNLIDRVWRGGVVDFISFQFGDYFFPIFNVADTLLVIGLILGLIFIIFTDSRHAFEEI
ncbi:MAG: signal peptidase II [Fastidiosipilaceae bacterium]|jgi:signal peptidase II|nr:signal peptidase II [Clostridiaceae bacterium]